MPTLPIPRWLALSALFLGSTAGIALGQDGAGTTSPPPAPQERDAPNAPGAPSKDAMRMGSPPSMPQDATRESMWPAPSADDWKQPCLVTWQRTWDDALRVSKVTGKPILICVNMDGEIASEHYAGIRYRRPDTARLYEPYVCVIASVYRHTPRDYDEEGRRIPCPRFGGVTCAEHIAIEPLLYDQYFDGQRVAPRHIMVELDKKETYDVYFAWDTQTIFTALVKGIEGRPPPPPDTRGDLPLAERTDSADVIDRIALEVAYREGTREVRRSLIESATRHRDVDQIDLLRQAILGLDAELARLARRALAQCDSEAAVDLLAEALKLPMEKSERELLLAACARLSEKYPRAQTLLALHQGLASSSKLIDTAAWTESGAAAARTRYESASRLERSASSAESRPADADAKLELAASFLARADELGTQRSFARVMLEDARRNALEAQKLGASGWKLHAVLAVTAAELATRDEALREAVLAVEGGLSPTAVDDGALDRSSARVFALFAQARQRAIAQAYRERKTWPPEWLADVHASYSVLARHPFGTDANFADHYDFLRWLGATPRASEVLNAGLARFPESRVLHERLRNKVLWDQGADALEQTYATFLAKEDAAPTLEWFTGYATLIGAEHRRRSGKAQDAMSAYERAQLHFERYIERFPFDKDDPSHYIALCRAGRARLALEAGDLERATRETLAAFRTRPASAASADGLNISPVDTAKMLRPKLAEAELAELAKELQAGLDALDPKMLELPAYERDVQGRAPRETRSRERERPR